MAFTVITLPTGYTTEQKKKFMAGMQDACKAAMKIASSFSWITEIPPENIGEGSEKIRSCIVYTTVGKTILQKNEVVTEFNRLCKEVLNETDSINIVIFKEHFSENTGSFGTIRSLKPIFENN